MNYPLSTQPIVEPIEVFAFPNPTKNGLFIEFTSNHTRNIAMYNASGIPVFNLSTHEDEVKLNVNDFPQGIYYLVIEENGNTITKKIQIQ